MSTLDFLKIPWAAFGITAPGFIWLAALFIFAATLLCLHRLWELVRCEEHFYHRLRSQLTNLRSTSSASPRDGMTAAMYEAMAQVFDQVASEAPSLLSAWRRFDAQLVVRRDPTGQERFWTPESAEATFNDTTVIEPRLNRGLFSAIPGVVTSAGLLCTFLAILIALLDVTLENEQFRGLDTLISGLSGKFLSSIVALFVATIYVLGERRLMHRLSQGLHTLTLGLDELVPRLTPARLLLTMQDHLEAQAGAWQHLSSDLATTLRQGLNEGMGPTMERMVHTVEELNQWLRVAETQRAEAATGSLEGLLQQLGHSLTTTLTSMSERFAGALSHSATQEFDSVASALHGSAQLLADMNAQFLATQGMFTSLVDLAKNSTAEQMTTGKAQVEELTTVLREMMAQMHDTAGLSVNRMAATLTAVVHDLSTKVAEMGERMSQTVTANTGQAGRVTQAIIGKVDQWSTRSTEQLAQLIDKHQAHLERVQDVQRTMEITLVQFKSALSEYATVTTGLKSVSAQTTAMVTAAAGAMKTLKETGEGIERVARLATAQTERLAETNRQQEEVQQRLAVNLQHYQQVFHAVEQAASQLLGQIDQHLRQYMTTTQQGFEHLTRTADEHFANAAQHLGDTVNGLDEHLQDLTDVLERLGRAGGANGRS